MQCFQRKIYVPTTRPVSRVITGLQTNVWTDFHIPLSLVTLKIGSRSPKPCPYPIDVSIQESTYMYQLSKLSDLSR